MDISEFKTPSMESVKVGVAGIDVGIVYPIYFAYPKNKVYKAVGDKNSLFSQYKNTRAKIFNNNEVMVCVKEVTDLCLENNVTQVNLENLNFKTFDPLINKLIEGLNKLDIIVRFVAPHYTSQECCKCGHTDSKNRVGRSSFVCKKCDAKMHADRNAAINIAARNPLRAHRHV